MRTRTLIGAIAAAVLAAGTAACGSDSPATTGPPTTVDLGVRVQAPTANGDVTIEVVDFAFKDDKATIKAGQSVKWNQKGGVGHTVTGEKNAWDSGRLETGTAYVVKYEKVGTFQYICTIHPSMKGTITVT